MRWNANGPMVMTIGSGCLSNHGPRKITDRETRRGGDSFRFRMERFAVSMAALSEAYLFPRAHTKTTDGTCEGLQFVPLLLT